MKQTAYFTKKYYSKYPGELPLTAVCLCYDGEGTVLVGVFIFLVSTPDIHDFISDMVLLHVKNKAVSLKVANSVVHMQS